MILKLALREDLGDSQQFDQSKQIEEPMGCLKLIAVNLAFVEIILVKDKEFSLKMNVFMLCKRHAAKIGVFMSTATSFTDCICCD